MTYPDQAPHYKITNPDEANQKSSIDAAATAPSFGSTSPNGRFRP